MSSKIIKMTLLCKGGQMPFLNGSPYPKQTFNTDKIDNIIEGFLLPPVEGIGGRMRSFMTHTSATDEIPALQFGYRDPSGTNDLSESYIVSGSIADYLAKANHAEDGTALILTPLAPYNS